MEAELVRKIYSLGDKVEFSKVSEAELTQVLRYVGTTEDSKMIIEESKNLSEVFLNLLDIALEDHEDLPSNPESIKESSSVAAKRPRLAIRLLVNSANRSRKFKESLPNTSISHFRALLRIHELRNDFFALLTSIAMEIHRAFALQPSYPLLIGELALVFESLEDDSARAWLSSFFAEILEKDYGFLSNSFGELAPTEFTALLNCVEILMDTSEHGTVIKVHPNNVQFCVDFLERIFFELKEENYTENLENIQLILQIVASAALRRANFDRELFQKTSALQLAIMVVESVLDSEILMEQEGKSRNSRKKHVLEDKKLILLSNAFVAENATELGQIRRATIKLAAVSCIGNLSSNCRLNQLAASENGGMLAVLQCTKKTQNDRSFIMQWAIAALRHMTLNCPENQQFILDIDDQPSGIIDRENLLRELGINVK